MIPGPRPAAAETSSDAVRDGLAALLPALGPPVEHNRSVQPTAQGGTTGETPVSLTRTPRGWCVVSPAGVDEVDGLVEGMTLADLVAEEFGGLAEPDRLTRRSVRGTADAGRDDVDPVDARVAALERTVTQLEHALAARVATERAIGVLAERFGTDPRAAFESLRRDARCHGRPVAELAREVLDAMLPHGDAASIAVVPPVRRLSPPGGAAIVPFAVDGRS